ncbi:trypsin-like peptidase domain-containing protein [Streptomyces asoensis]|uniref:Trypsin-like peptidase domain-containing protein n=1 Tax=Streptomyces asoensis TaxID=249586 RepID=A0A6M4WHI3_9ACTN|nr:serine protease [Streptomyces asoensis]QJS99281.1 trypsin-like peptidase domain-containing protein [Streptomyces asoensis]
MTWAARSRAVEVVNRTAQSYGSGCLIAPGLVLTARHVAQPGTGRIQVRDLEGGDFAEALTIWDQSSGDITLLRIEHRNFGETVPVVRFGELVGTDPAHRPRCTTTGFPRSMRRRAGTAGAYVDDAKTVDGYVTPATGARSQRYALEIGRALPADVADWQGMSGAGLFCEGVLVGVIASVPTRLQGLLLAIPVVNLLSDDGFVRAVAEHTGMRPQLLPADLQPLLTGVPEPRLSSTYLLDPRAQVVSLTGMTHLISRIERWCHSRDGLDVAAVTGLGGTGKSRLVTEILKRLAHPPPAQPKTPPAQPWAGGFLAEHPRHTDYRMLASAHRPLLIAVDFAETRRSQILDLARAVAESREGGPAIRILLLARRHASWWPQLRRELRILHAGLVEQSFSVRPHDVWDVENPTDVYETAKSSFVERIRQLQQAGHGDSTWKQVGAADIPCVFGDDTSSSGHTTPVIYRHISALADVLTCANPEAVRRDHPLQVLLATEEDYLRRVAEALLPPQTFDAPLIRSLVTAQYLAGAGDIAQARAVVTAAFDAHHHGFGSAAPPDKRLLASWVNVLATAYPATDHSHWGAIGEPLAAVLLGEVESESGHTFVEDFLTHEALIAEQHHHALQAIARSASEQPHTTASAHRAVAAAPERLLDPALKAVTALKPDHARLWLRLLHEALLQTVAHSRSDQETRTWGLDILARARRFAVEAEDELAVQIDVLLAAGDALSDSNPQGATHDQLLEVPRAAVEINLKAGPVRRAVVALTATLHLAITVIVTLVAALEAAPAEQWIWLLVPATLGTHLTVAALYTRSRFSVNPLTVLAPPLAVLLLVVSGTHVSHSHPPPGFLPAWLMWSVLTSVGLYNLTLAAHLWFGPSKPGKGAHGLSSFDSGVTATRPETQSRKALHTVLTRLLRKSGSRRLR